MEKNLSRFLLVLSSVPIMVILLRSFQHKEYKNNKKVNMLCCRPFRCSCDWSTAVCVGVFIGFFFSLLIPRMPQILVVLLSDSGTCGYSVCWWFFVSLLWFLLLLQCLINTCFTSAPPGCCTTAVQFDIFQRLRGTSLIWFNLVFMLAFESFLLWMFVCWPLPCYALSFCFCADVSCLFC